MILLGGIFGAAAPSTFAGLCLAGAAEGASSHALNAYAAGGRLAEDRPRGFAGRAASVDTFLDILDRELKPGGALYELGGRPIEQPGALTSGQLDLASSTTSDDGSRTIRGCSPEVLEVAGVLLTT